MYVGTVTLINLRLHICGKIKFLRTPEVHTWFSSTTSSSTFTAPSTSSLSYWTCTSSINNASVSLSGFGHVLGNGQSLPIESIDSHVFRSSYALHTTLALNNLLLVPLITECNLCQSIGP